MSKVAPEPPAVAASRVLDEDAKVVPLAADLGALREHIATATTAEVDQLRLAQAEAHLELVSERQELARAGTECDFWFVVAERLLADEKMTKLPTWQDLQRDRPDWLVRKRLTFEEAMHGSFAAEILGISHRWETPAEPDTKGAQLTAVRAHLRAHPRIRWVWFDFACMPQGKRTASDQRLFDYMLANINLVFLGASVLCLVDLSYMSRFWTQFEAWLACQEASAHGLVGATAARRRISVATILNAPPSFEQALLDMWAAKTPKETCAILAEPDVLVTNQKDKDTQIGKVSKLDQRTVQAWARNEQRRQMDAEAGVADAHAAPAAAPQPAPQPKPQPKPQPEPKPKPKPTPNPQQAAVNHAAPPVPQEMQRYNEPPNPRPKFDTFFWRYRLDAGSNFPGHLCYTCLCPCCSYSETRQWAKGTPGVLIPPLIPCQIEEARRDIEAKLHRFHRERGDPRAHGKPASHAGVCFFAPCCCHLMLAENLDVVKRFAQTQGKHAHGFK